MWSQGRGKSGLDAQQLEDFDAAVAVLEESGGLKVCLPISNTACLPAIFHFVSGNQSVRRGRATIPGAARRVRNPVVCKQACVKHCQRGTCAAD